MTKRINDRKLLREGYNPNPYKRLALAVIAQAVCDLEPARVRKNPERALGASVFLLQDGPLYAEACGWEVDPAHWEVLVNGTLK